ncbi:glycerol acyltransferase [Aggregatimonas sangjinii]|uniref:Glycerol acyltransferase n=1 Tax=Aggregatimonas sangjinii TaxID=2583587 RepID=A0A5B7SVE5_9FLAO|nr:lysophospholipid acyltransferase family protein [Aggregatimonas sangjinii]QCX00810.1 glycerol acyltransferase [Aggregatimonas sangjinii]
MKNLGYILLKYWVKVGLYCYYGKIRMVGKEHIPKNKPVLFLPNHQSALMEVLLLAVDCDRKPWFLTRSDVFKKPTLKRLFAYLQMIPIYRIRDGRDSLKKNDAVFERCAELFAKNEAILMFPEANHNIKRRVRPLSKGFTRILFGTLDKYPELDIQLVPVGLNYKDSKAFPDRIAIIFGKPIAVKGLYQKEDIHASTNVVKEAVATSLKTLTTHIDDEANYETIIAQLEAFGVNFLKPREVNEVYKRLETRKTKVSDRPKSGFVGTIFRFIFTLLNLPLVLGWWLWMKPKVWEPEFTATLRFGYAFLASPLYYFLIFIVVSLVFTPFIGALAVLGVFGFNWVYVKLA